MSYHNPPLCLPSALPTHQISLPIVDCYFRQHSVMVDLLTHEKLKRNGWSLLEPPFYPGNVTHDTNDTCDKDTAQTERKEPDEMNDTSIKNKVEVNEKLSFDLGWIDHGRIFKKIQKKNIKGDNLGQDSHHKIFNLESEESAPNNNNVVSIVANDIMLQDTKKKEHRIIRREPSTKEGNK